MHMMKTHGAHKRYHWLGAALWLLSLLAFVFAWIASFRTAGTFLGLPVAHLYWDALILGVLALGVKVKNVTCYECQAGGSEESTEEAK